MKKQASALPMCLLIVGSFLYVSNSFGQSRTEIAQATWPPKKSSQSSSAMAFKPAEWEPEIFNFGGGNLPPDFQGVDPKKFYELWKRKLDGLKKGEFETTSEFEARKTNLDELLAPIKKDVLYAFRINQASQGTYDPDTQTYRFGSYMFPNCQETTSYSKTPGWVTCEVTDVSKTIDVYEAGNSYGATAAVKRYRGTTFSLALPKGDRMRVNYLLKEPRNDRYTQNISVKVPIEKAKALKGQTISTLYVGWLFSADQIEGAGLRQKPTLSDPTDMYFEEVGLPFALQKIVFYVQSTGEVIGSVSRY